MSGNRKRKNPIQFYLNDDELEKLERRIKEYGFEDKSSYIRSAILESIYIHNSCPMIYKKQIDIIIERVKSILRIIKLKQKTSITPEELKCITEEIEEINNKTYKIWKSQTKNI